MPASNPSISAAEAGGHCKFKNILAYIAGFRLKLENTHTKSHKGKMA